MPEATTKRPNLVRDDPVEAGKVGGVASGIARRRRYVDRLRAKVLSDSGMGSYAAMRAWTLDLDERERQCGERELVLMDAADRLRRLREEAEQERQRAEVERRRVVSLRERGNRLDVQLGGEISALERRRDALRAEIEMQSRAAGLEWVDDEDDDGVAPA